MNKNYTLSMFVRAFLLVCAFTTHTAAQTAKPTVNIQGTLKDASGRSVDDGKYQVTFRLYSAETGGTLLWQETANVDTRGGIYSYNIGSVNTLTPSVFGSTVYMSIEFNGFELTPRTVLTYSPYAFACTIAQSADCSGAPGDIKYSILAPADFKLVNGDCWVPMNGATLSASSVLRMITGRTTLPDGGGLFIQGQEFVGGTNYDSDRTPASPIATLQADAMNKHSHTTQVAGNHSHTFYDYVECCGGYSSFDAHLISTSSGSSDGNDQNAIFSFDYIVQAGNHNHTVNASGGSETRSKNLNLWIYICIN
jgi:hypothetical protein